MVKLVCDVCEKTEVPMNHPAGNRPPGWFRVSVSVEAAQEPSYEAQLGNAFFESALTEGPPKMRRALAGMKHRSPELRTVTETMSCIICPSCAKARGLADLPLDAEPLGLLGGC